MGKEVKMTIDKAIEILSFVKQERIPIGELDELAACNLGIEALKKWEEYRACDKVWWGNLLPGETEE